LRFHAEAPA
jgi:hypothetical protein